MVFRAQPPRALALAVLVFAAGYVSFPTPARADAYTDVQSQLDGGRFRAALKGAQALTAANAQDCRAWALQAESQRRLTDFEGAIRAYKEGLAACGSDKVLLRGVATIFDEREQYDDAATYYGQLWALDRSDQPVGSRYAHACFKADRCDEGRTVFDALLQLNPGRIEDRQLYAELLARTCRDFAAADAQYQTLIKGQPGNLSFHCARAFMLTEAGRLEDAVAAAQAGIAAIPAGNGCLYAAWGRALDAGGDSLFTKGKVTEAREMYRQAVTPLEKGLPDVLFGSYCKVVLADVRYKEAPMEELK